MREVNWTALRYTTAIGTGERCPKCNKEGMVYEMGTNWCSWCEDYVEQEAKRYGYYKCKKMKYTC